MKTDKALKSKITQLWNIISDHQTSVPNVGSNEFKAKAFAQLEYVLIEADLLAQRRERPSERAMRETAIKLAQPAETEPRHALD